MFEDLLSEPQIYRKIQKKKMSTKNQIGFAANIPWDNSITTAHETTPANLSISGAPPSLFLHLQVKHLRWSTVFRSALRACPFRITFPPSTHLVKRCVPLIRVYKDEEDQGRQVIRRSRRRNRRSRRKETGPGWMIGRTAAGRGLANIIRSRWWWLIRVGSTMKRKLKQKPEN